jgi:hypothetical protein
VRRIVINSVLLAAAMAFVAPMPAQDPASAQPLAAGVQPALTPATAPAISSQALSQPGARGQLHPAIVPPVPVPPGPVAPTQIKPAPPTPIAVKKVELRGDDPWDPEWDVLIEENLPPELLSSQVDRDVKPFCPRFNLLPEADKRAFWAYFFQALAGAEAGLTPTSDVRHSDPSVATVDPVTHHISRQEGLLQLKYEDSERYGCDFDWDHDKNLPVHDPGKTILNPRNNLLCGIRILRNQLIDLHQPLRTRKSYWGTLHPGTAGYRNFAHQMANVPEACGQRVEHRRPRAEQPLDEALFTGHPSTGQMPPVSSFRSQP